MRGRAAYAFSQRRGHQEAQHRADRQSSRDDNLLGVRPPGPSPRDAVSTKSSKDERPKRSLRETLTGRVGLSAPHRTNDVDTDKRRRTLKGVPDPHLLTTAVIEGSHDRMCPAVGDLA
jgi:hypothetical protein